MKKLLLTMLGVLMALPAMAQFFDYEYEGQTLPYCVIDEDAKTVMVYSNGEKYSGDLILPSEVSYNNTQYTLTEIGYQAFYGCSGLTSVTIPNSVTSIGDYAFSDCTGLTSVTIPNSVKTIGDRAFYNCYSLHSVTIGSSVTSIGSNFIGSNFNSDFDGKVAYPNTLGQLSVLASYEFAYDPETAEAHEDGCVYSKDGKSLLFVPADVKSFEIPEGVTTIGSMAFFMCGLESLTIPGSIETVEGGAFVYCEIARVNFTDWEKWYANAKLGNLESNPYRNNGAAYAGGIKVPAPELKDGMEEIPDYINVGLSPYKDEIEIPSSIKRIGAYAFYNNKELYHVFLLEGLEEIGESAFEGCELLENQDLPSTLVSIEDKAYKGCTSLTEVVLPEGLTELGNGVFSGCTKLEKAVLVSDIEALGHYLFMDCDALNKLYLPLNLKHIGDYTFHNCQALDQITLPSTLETIGAAAFSITRDEGSLSKLTIPNSVTSIGSGAFQSQKIANLTIGSGLTTITRSAFSENPLNVIKFSEGLTSIEEGAFQYYGSESTAQVILPSTF